MKLNSLLGTLALVATMATITVAQDNGLADSKQDIIPAEPLEDIDIVIQPSVRAPGAAQSLFDMAADPSPEAPAEGRALLDACIARMPTEPLYMKGTLTMRKAYGVELKKYGYAVTLQWGAMPPAAKYDVFNLPGGGLVEAIEVVRDPSAGLGVRRFTGIERIQAEAPVLNERVLGTDITWLDITLDYLWWKNPTLGGSEKVKGRLCDILEVEPPAPLPGCAKARLWIDRDQQVLMRAAQVNENGRETRRMWVRAIQKVDGRWVLKDLEVETLGSGHRTRLHVDEVKVAQVFSP
ncbi:MAG: outer membrane lipoprotein-sorting protein [Kiritimatiellia bacterium]